MHICLCATHGCLCVSVVECGWLLCVTDGQSTEPASVHLPELPGPDDEGAGPVGDGAGVSSCPAAPIPLALPDSGAGWAAPLPFHGGSQEPLLSLAGPHSHARQGSPPPEPHSWEPPPAGQRFPWCRHEWRALRDLARRPLSSAPPRQSASPGAPRKGSFAHADGAAHLWECVPGGGLPSVLRVAQHASSTPAGSPAGHWTSAWYEWVLASFCCCYWCWCWLLLYSTILCSRADSLCSHVILHEWLVFHSFFFWISNEVMYLQLSRLVCNA